MTQNQKPGVLLRCSTQRAGDNLSPSLETDFRILTCTSDDEAMAMLTDAEQHLIALVIMDLPPGESGPHGLLSRARDQYPRLLKVLIGDAIGLSTLTSLLDAGLIDRCFEHPVNPDQLRSHLLATALLRHDRVSADDQSAPSENNPPSVLIVDDETTATKYLSRQLNRMQSSFQVLCADSAETALELIDDPHNGIAVVMTDQRMPGLQGKELLDKLRLSRPDIVRILTSAYGEVGVALDAVNEGGIFRYQTKPWKADKLLPVFQEALGLHRALKVKHRCQVNETEQAFRAIVEQRIQSLQSTLGPLVDNLAGGPATRAFLETLSSIETLPPNSSHVRSSQETALERQLLEAMADRVRQGTARLSPGPEALIWTDHAQLRHRWRQAVSEEEAADDDAPENAGDLLFRSIAVLLHASGLGADSLTIESHPQSGQIRLTVTEPLRIYTHLLAPLTRLSRPLLDQQCALLLTHLAIRKLSAEMHIQGQRQSCRLAMALPLGRTRDQAR